MRSRSGYTLLLVLPFLIGLGCAPKPTGDQHETGPGHPPPPPAQEKVEFPPLGPAKRLERNVDFHEATVQRAGQPMRVWVYVPEHAAGQKLPCVLIGPAGSTLIVGMALAEGDRAEHLPFARVGFVVISYDIDGPQPAGDSDDAFIAAVTAFKNANAGVSNARTALDFALKTVPDIDPDRVYCAGHSSAATLALLVAAAEPRIKACAAFAPVTDVETRIGKRIITPLAAAVPGFEEFIKSSSPKTHAAELKCPVFLFHARDDTTVPIGESTRFAADLKRTNPRVTFVEVPKGGHYDSMIRAGIPKAIEWFRTLPG
jgi:dienelactone hydrolase